jgi:GNAT superfamily N-acetyltransferase
LVNLKSYGGSIPVEDLTLMVFDTDDARRADTLRVLGTHLGEYRRWETGGAFRQSFTVLCDQAGKVRGGLISYTHGEWLGVEFVWVEEAIRRQGHGSRLLHAAEREAVSRGCRRAYLDTAASPAEEFFRNQGYNACGELTDYLPGRSRYWFQKVFQ